MRPIKLLWIALSFWLMWTDTTAQSFSLKEAVDYAQTNHPNIIRNDLQKKSAEWQIKEYWSRGIPTVNGEVGYQHFFELPTTILPEEFTMGGSNEVQFGTTDNVVAGVNAGFLLFDGSFFVGLKAQRAYKELVALEIGETLRDVEVNVTMAYLNVLTLQEALGISNDNLSSITSMRDEAKAFYENGFAEQLDVDRLDLTINNLNAEISNTERMIASSIVVLKYQMGHPLDEVIELTDDLNTLEAKQANEELLNPTDWTPEDRVEYDVVDQSINLSDINIKAIKAEYFPSIHGSLSYQQQLQTNDLFGSSNKWFPIFVGGLSFSLPIYDAGNRKSRIGQAKVQREELLLYRSELTRAVQLEVTTTQISLQNAIENVAQRKAGRALAEKIFNTTQIKYNEGIGSSVEVHQAEVEMFKAQGEYINALYAYLEARTNVQRALGKI